MHLSVTWQGVDSHGVSGGHMATWVAPESKDSSWRMVSFHSGMDLNYTNYKELGEDPSP